jgi:hypothetical protein
VTVIGAGKDWVIRLVDGSELNVRTDQRDYAGLEAAEIKGAISAFRWMAWNAARRAKLYTGPWEQFNDVDCVEVEDVTPDDEDGEDEQSQGETAAGQQRGPADPYGVS